MRSVKLIDEFSGIGPVHFKDGDLIKEAEYDLQVFQEYKDASTKEGRASLPGLKRIEGQVRGLDNFTLLNDSTKLTLHLEDGRYLDFQIGDFDGRVVPNSGLYEP